MCLYLHMGGCQNYGPFWGTLNNRCRAIIRTHKGTIILTTTHIIVQYTRPSVGRFRILCLSAAFAELPKLRAATAKRGAPRAWLSMVWGVCICMHVCMYACCMYACMPACVYVCMYHSKRFGVVKSSKKGVLSTGFS